MFNDINTSRLYLHLLINKSIYNCDIINSTGSNIIINLTDSLETCENIFNHDYSYIESIDLSNFNTTNVCL